MMMKCKNNVALRENDNTMVFKKFQVHPMVDINFTKKKKLSFLL